MMYPSKDRNFIVLPYCHNASRTVLVAVYSCPGNSAKMECRCLCSYVYKRRNAEEVLDHKILLVDGLDAGRDGTLCNIAI